MKKIILPILALFSLLACNQTDNKSASDSNKLTDSLSLKSIENVNTTPFVDICNTAGLGNVTIGKSQADSMSAHFKEIYKIDSVKNKIVNDSFWVDACSIMALGKFFDASNDMAGLRIVFAAVKTADGTGNETKLFLVTTKDSSISKQTKTRDDKWDIFIPGTDCGSSKKYFSNFKGAVDQIKLYDKIFRENPSPTGTASKDSLSSKVWFDKCIFSKLAKFMTLNSSVDGINIKLGAYNSKDTILHHGQAYNNQSTVIIVPTTSKVDNWKIVEQIKIAVKNKFRDAGLNHGELCPQVCN